MQKNRKRKSWTAAIILLLFLAGLSGFVACGKKKAVDAGIPLQELVMEYPVDNPLAYAGAKDGGVYIVNYGFPDQTQEGESGYWLHHFDGQGRRDWYVSFGEDYSMVETLAISEDGKQLYFTAQNPRYGIDIYLFSCSVEDGGMTMLCALPYFDHVRQLAVVRDAVYLLGQSPNWQEKKPPDSGFLFSGERLVAYRCGTGEQVQLGFDFPVSMSVSGAGTLMVFGYLDQDGYCMMEYDPGKDSMQVISKLKEYKFDCFAACNGGKDIIYDYNLNSRGLVLSGVRELSLEAELYPDSMTQRIPPGYAGGRVYCYSMGTGGLVSFPLDAVQKDNRELTFISEEYGTLNAPYGCGYSIKRVELPREKLTLKILARDRDFDLCMGNTLLGDGGRMRENGTFYPLNGVPEIEGYLDRCFPYVREAATREDGTIWMLPVEVNVYGMVVRQEAAKEAGLFVHDGMTWGEFAQALGRTKEESREWINADASFLTSVFGDQYFMHYHTLDACGVFSDAYTALAQIWKMGCGSKVTQKKFILTLTGGPMWFGSGGDYTRWEYGEDAVYIAMPKPSAAEGNIAHCVFLAVNPDSARRDDALSYLAALAAYLSQSKELPFFKDWQGEGILDESLYEAYENGEIGFSVDYDVYGEGFYELFSGELSLLEYIEKTKPKLGMYWEE